MGVFLKSKIDSKNIGAIINDNFRAKKFWSIIGGLKTLESRNSVIPDFGSFLDVMDSDGGF